MSSASLQKAVEQLGAAAIAMNMAEVYGALQTGMIDGWENNLATCIAFSMYETGCIHFSWTRHVAIPDILILSKRWLEGIALRRLQRLEGPDGTGRPADHALPPGPPRGPPDCHLLARCGPLAAPVAGAVTGHKLRRPVGEARTIDPRGLGTLCA
jgi:hypothetical protein